MAGESPHCDWEMTQVDEGESILTLERNTPARKKGALGAEV